MQSTDIIHQHIKTDIDRYTEKILPPLQHQWPLLSRSQQVLAYLPASESMTEQDKKKRQNASNEGQLKISHPSFDQYA